MLWRRLTFHLAIPLGALLTVGCEAPTTPSRLPNPPTPNTPDQPARHQRNPERPVAISLGEVVEIVLDAAVSAGWYCGLGDADDPAPCEWFVVDVPRSGTLVIRMEFDTAHPMFVGLHERFSSDQSPLIARQAVESGVVKFTAGLAVPYGLPGGEVRFMLVASLE